MIRTRGFELQDNWINAAGRYEFKNEKGAEKWEGR